MYAYLHIRCIVFTKQHRHCTLRLKIYEKKFVALHTSLKYRVTCLCWCWLISFLKHKVDVLYFKHFYWKIWSMGSEKEEVAP